MTDSITPPNVNSQATNPDSEVSVNSTTGEVYISQRKAAIEIGIALSSLQGHCLSRNYDIKQGLNRDTLLKCVIHFASTDSKKTYPKAIALLKYLSSIPDWKISDVLSFGHQQPKNSRKNTSGYVYLLECESFYKIGMASKSVDDRVCSMQTGNPFPITCVFYKKVKNAYAAESHLHHKYREYSHRGEWFRDLPVDEVILSMEAIK